MRFSPVYYTLIFLEVIEWKHFFSAFGPFSSAKFIVRVKTLSVLGSESKFHWNVTNLHI